MDKLLQVSIFSLVTFKSSRKEIEDNWEGVVFLCIVCL